MGKVHYEVGDIVIIKSHEELKKLYDEENEEFLQECITKHYCNIKGKIIEKIHYETNNQYFYYKLDIDNGDWDWYEKDFVNNLGYMLKNFYT